MQQFLEAIKTELKQQQIKYGYTDVHTLMEHIWRTYTEENPISNEKLRTLEGRMDPILNSLPNADSDKLFLIFWEFCQEYERAAFLDGFRLGIRLMIENQSAR
jgi:hypothetical protein